MAGRLGVDGGGISGLLELIRQHKEALEYHLITLGLRLDWLSSEALSWRDLLVIVKHCGPGSAIHRSVAGSDADWGMQEQLLAGVFDGVQLLAWLQSEDGAKGRNRPKLLPRPGVTAEDEQRIGSDGVDIVDMAAWLAKQNPAQHPRAV